MASHVSQVPVGPRSTLVEAIAPVRAAEAHGSSLPQRDAMALPGASADVTVAPMIVMAGVFEMQAQRANRRGDDGRDRRVPCTVRVRRDEGLAAQGQGEPLPRHRWAGRRADAGGE
jgi:hypothetical protein